LSQAFGQGSYNCNATKVQLAPHNKKLAPYDNEQARQGGA
jgi:hypothetical protein